jgi:hypothetical protein
MRVVEIKKIVLSSKEYNDINNALDIICDIAKDSQTSHIVNSQLPCGYGIEDIRDSLQYLTDIVEVE